MTMFTLEKLGDIALVTMNDKSQVQNVLNQSVSDEFKSVLTKIQTDDELKGLIFTSSKKDCFVAGADINVLQDATTKADAQALSELLQGLTQEISRLSITTVAAIDGACLGGGLELALPFDYRIATLNPKTKLGLPEVQLGLLPGGSGTQRLPRLISLPTALDLLLTGRQLNAKRAYHAGLVDEVVAPEVLLAVAQKWVKKGKAVRAKSFKEKLMFDNLLSRQLVFSQARKKTFKSTKGHYPAPLKILEVTQVGLSSSFEQGLKVEAEKFAELVMSPESKQLINLFFASTELKKDSGVDSGVQAFDVGKVGVLGAGLMGAGISLVTIEKADIDVRLKDINAQGLARGVSYIGGILDKKLRRRYITRLGRSKILAKLTTTKDYSGFKNVDVVIEAVFEDLGLKQKMVADIEALAANKDIIFATNTSAIPIDDIAAKAKHPERIVGMHYFSPVEKMPLLEVIAGSKTADWVTATAVGLGKKQGKTVIVVNDGPGFYTTRILVPYIMEAVRMVEEGVAIEDIDQALENYGFPVGPVKLMDEVGIDVGSHIVETLHEAFGARIPLIDGMQKVLDDGRKGRKNKRGFYQYVDKNGDKAKSKEVDESVYQVLGLTTPERNTLSAQKIVERCVLTMLNEAAYCYGEKILRSARDGDIGAIFGLGFPPFLGGPFQVMDSMGVVELIKKLEALQKDFGERFTVAPVLLELQKEDCGFYQ